MGALHSKNTSAPVSADDQNNEKGIYSKGGMKVVFNDQEESITMSTSDGSKISMDKTGITIDAGSGMVTIKGSTIMLN